MISFIFFIVIALAILILAVVSAVRHENEIIFIRKNEIFRQIRYDLPQQIEFAYSPFRDTLVNFGTIAALCFYAFYPVELPVELTIGFFILKTILFFLAVHVMHDNLRTIWIYGVRKRSALCLNRETFQFFNYDIEWKAIQEIVYSEDEDGQSLSVSYIPENSEQIMSSGFDFIVIKDSYQVILPAVEKYWRICSGQTDIKITHRKQGLL